MANGGQVTYGINFNVDQSGLQQAKKSLQDIQKMSLKDMQIVNPKIDASAFANIRKQASELQDVLAKSFNSTLGTWNLQSLQNAINKIDVNKAYASLSRLGAQGKTTFREMSIEAMTASNQIQKTTGFLDRMGETMIKTVKWGIASRVMNDMAGSVQQAYGYIKSLDSSLNDIRIVTGKSADEMDRFAIQANKAAQQLGKSTTDYTNASLIYYQQGLSDEEVKARTETTLKAASVTGQDTAAVSEQLTAVWNGFKIGAEESELAVDKLAAVAASTASDLEELATGMSKVSSAANAMGVTEDQLAATLSTIISVTRDAPESVGTAMKTIYARMGDLKIDGVDEFGTKLGDVTSQMQTMGIQVLDQQGNLRDMGTIIEEVGEKWDGWSRSQQQAAAIALAGKRQYNNLIALFDNWDQYTQALNTSMSAQGTLEQQNGIYLESLAAKTEQYHAAIENLEDSLLDSSSFKTMLDGITGITNGIATFVDAIGGGGTALLGLGAIFTQVFNKQIATELTNFTKNFTNTVTNLDEAKARAKVQQQFNLQGENDKILAAVSNNAQKLEMSGIATSQDWDNLKNLSLEYEKAQSKAEALERETKQVEKQLQELGVTDSLEDLAKGFEKSEAGAQELESHIRDLLKINNLTNLVDTLDQIDQNADSGANAVQKLVNELKQVGQGNIQVQELIELLQQARFEDTPDENGVFHIDTDQLDLIRDKVQEIKDETTTQIDVVTQASEDAVNVIQQDGQQIQQEAESAQTALNEFGNSFGDVTKAQVFLQYLQGIQSIAFGLASIGNIIKIIDDEDLSAGEKAIQIMMALSSAIPMVVIGVQSISKARLMDAAAAQLENASSMKNVGSLIAETVAKAGLTAQTIALTLANEGLAAAIMATPIGWILGALALATAGVIAITKAVEYFSTTQEREAKAAKEHADQVSAAYQQITQEVSNAKSELEQYQDARDGLSELTTGTEEWKEAVAKLNEQVMALIDKYPELAEGLEITNGLISINEDTMKKFITEKQKQQAQIGIEQASANKTQVREQHDVDRKQGLSEVNNTVVGEGYQNVYNAGMTISEDAYKNLSDDLKWQYQKVNEQLSLSQDEYNRILNAIVQHGEGVLKNQQFLEKQLGIASHEAEVIANNEQAQGLLLAQSNKEVAENTAAESQRKAAISNYLLQDEGFSELASSDDETSQQLANVVKEAVSKKLSENSRRVKEELEKLSQKTDDEIEKIWAEQNNYTKDDKGNYTDENGQEVEFNADLVRQELAEVQAATNLVENDLPQIIEGVKTALSNVDEQYQQAIAEWRSGEGLDSLTPEQKDALQSETDPNKVMEMLGLTEENIHALGFTSAKTFTDAMQEAIQESDAQLESYFQSISEKAQEAKAQLDEISNQNGQGDFGSDLTNQEQMQLGGDLESAYNVSDLAGDALTSIFSEGTEEALKFSNAIKDIDWGSFDNLNDAIDALGQEYDITEDNIDALADFAHQEMLAAEASKELTDALDEDVDEDQWKDLSDYIEDNIDSIEGLDKSLKGDRKAIENVAEELLRYDSALESVQNNYDDWKDLLASDNNIMDNAQAVSELSNAYADLLGMDASSLGADFLNNADNLELFKQAAEGSEDAYNQLLQAAGQSILVDLGIDTSQYDSDLAYVQENMSLIENEDITIGASVETDAFLQGLTDMVNAAGMTQQQATDYLSSMGVDAQVEIDKTSTPETKTTTGFSSELVPHEATGSVPVVSGEGEGMSVTSEPISYTVYSSKYTPQQETVTDTKEDSAFSLKVTSAGKSTGGGFKFNNSSHGGGSAGRAARKPSGGGGHGGGGGGGKGSSTKVGKKAKKAHKKDRYHDLNNNLTQLNHNLKMQGQLEDQLVGNKLVDKLNEEVTAYDKLIRNTKNYIKEQDKDLATRRKKLKKMTGIKIKFEADGQIDEKQYNKIIGKYQKKYNKLVKKYNKARKGSNGEGITSEEQEKWDKRLEKAENKLNKVKDKLDKYDDIYEQRLEKIEQLQEYYYAKLEKKLQVYTTKLQNTVDKWNHKIESHTDALAKLEHQMNMVAEAQNHLRGNDYIKSLTKQNQLIQKQINHLKQQQKFAQQSVKELRKQMDKGYKIEWNEVNRNTGKTTKKTSKIDFQFNKDGTIKNEASLLNNAKTKAEREAIQEAIDKYYEQIGNVYDYIEQRQELEYQKLSNTLEKITTKLQNTADAATNVIDQLNQKLSIMEFRLNKLQRAQNKLVGQKYINNLKKQNSELTKQYNNYKKQNEESATAIKNMQKQMAVQKSFAWTEVQADGSIKSQSHSYKFKFDKNGNITNGDKLLAAAKTQEEYDAIKAQIDAYNEQYEQWISSGEQMLDITDQLAENRINAFEYKINLQYEFNDLSDAWADFQRSYINTWDEGAKQWINDTTQEGLLKITQGIQTAGETYLNRLGQTEIEGLRATASTAIDEWQKAYNGDGTGVYGTNAQAALENMKRTEEQMRSTIQSAFETAKQAHDSFLKSIDLGKEEFNRQKGYLSTLQSFIQHDLKATQLAYGKNSSQINKYYNKLEQNYQKQEQISRKEAKMWYDRMQKAEKGSEEWQKYYDNWLAATQEVNTALENQMQNVLDKINLKIEQTYTNLAKLSNGTTVQETSEMWQMQLTDANKYLDTINQAYSVEQLRAKYTDSINSLDGNLKAQQQLNKLMDDQLKQLEEAGQLRQYDVDRAEKLYNIALKQIALEEAQQNKSKLKLRRDSQGNYTYRYVQDTDQVNKAQQELNSAQQDLYNTDKKQREDTISEYYSTYNSMLTKLKQLDNDYANGTITDENEYLRLRQFYQEQYGEKLEKIQTDLNTVTENLNQSALISMQSLYEQGSDAVSGFRISVSDNWDLLYDKASSVIDGVGQYTIDNFMNETVPNFKEGTALIGTAFTELDKDKIAPALQNIQNETKQAKADLQSYAATILTDDNNATEAVDTLTGNIDELVDSTNTSIDATQTIDTTMQNLASTIQSQVIPAWQALTQEMSNYYQTEASYQGTDIGTGDLKLTPTAEGNLGTGAETNSPGNAGATSSAVDKKNTALEKAKAAYKKLRKDHGPDLKGPNGKTGANITRKEAWTVLTPLIDAGYKNTTTISSNKKKQSVSISDDNLKKLKKMIQKAGFYDYGLATGGYTGDWPGTDGKLAVLHSKEIVLNKDDTKNFLAAIEVTRAIADQIGGLAYATHSANFNTAQGATTNQSTATSVTIYADFPAVNKASEIEVAFNNLKARASQVAAKN